MINGFNYHVLSCFIHLNIGLSSRFAKESGRETSNIWLPRADIDLGGNPPWFPLGKWSLGSSPTHRCMDAWMHVVCTCERNAGMHIAIIHMHTCMMYAKYSNVTWCDVMEWNIMCEHMCIIREICSILYNYTHTCYNQTDLSWGHEYLCPCSTMLPLEPN